MMKNVIYKFILLIACIVLIVVSGGYAFYKYVILPELANNIVNFLNPVVEETEILRAEKILSEIESLTIYSTSTYTWNDSEGKEIININEISDDIDRYEIDKQTINKIFSKVLYKPEHVLWKGDKLGIAKLVDGSEVKIRISYYGGFFSIIGIEGYYLIDDSLRQEWDDIIRIHVLNRIN